ncbi:MAG TPA: ABC transporter substrate-binding protein, partial [Bacillota bacterium]|nr:ABC transporter substrate-binding protein [Bacillota bacterium]
LSSPKSNIKTAQDLKNVPIAISQNTIIEFVTDMLLREQGVDQKDINKISVPKIPVRMQMVACGQLQAAVLPDPLGTLAEKQGGQVILDDTKITKNLTQTVIIISEKRISSDKESVRKLVDVYGEAGKAITDRPEQYRSLLIEKAKVPKPIQSTYTFPAFSQPQLPAAQDFDRVMNWMVEKKLLDKAYSYDELVDSTILTRG